MPGHERQSCRSDGDRLDQTSCYRDQAAGIPRSQKDLEPKKIQHECRPCEATHDIYIYTYALSICYHIPLSTYGVFMDHVPIYSCICVYIHIYPIYRYISHLYPQTLSPGIFLVQLIHISFACGLEIYHQR